ncbi:Phage-related baseplate assembly protein [compost metagenome]
MSDPVNEPSFRLEIAGQSQAFTVVAFTGYESISTPFVFRLELQLDEKQLDLASLMYRPAYLCLGEARVGIHGQIHDLVQLHGGANPGLWRVSLGPKLTCLGQRFSQRIFSRQSVPQILAQVLREHGIGGEACRFVLQDDYPALDFCTQYRESDLAFVQRLCEQARIHYYFLHCRGSHCLVFTDTLSREPVVTSESFDVEGATLAVKHFKVHAQTREGDPQCPASIHAEAETDLSTLRSGQVLALSEHPCAAWNGQWLLTRVEHAGRSMPVPHYCNRLWAMPADRPFEPGEPHPKPRMSSVQRGWIVDVEGAHSDSARRVAVQFDWLYQGEGASPSHCWLPVSTLLSDEAVAGLTAGVQVCVSFIDGDPDQPLITGIFQPAMLAGDAVLSSETRPASGSEALLQLQINAAMFVGTEQQVQLSGGQALTVDPHSQRHFKVGCSEVRFDGADIRLSSPNIHLKASKPAPVKVMTAQSAALTPAAHHDWLAQVRCSQPLVLLCLLPGGGSLRYCRLTICVCRMAAGFGQSGVA